MNPTLRNSITDSPARAPQRSLAAVIVAALVFLIGCATEVSTFTRTGKSYPPKAKDFQVEVFTNGLPTKPFDRVAILDVHCESQAFMTPNLQEDALPMLIKKAREAGCDALIEIQERQPQGNWTLETRVKMFSAIGIVYK